MLPAVDVGSGDEDLEPRIAGSHDNPDWDPAYAQRIIDAREGDDVVFSAIYGPSRALRSEGLTELVTLTASGADNDNLTRFKDLRLLAGQRDGDMSGCILPCGQIAGAITDMIHVAQFVPQA